MSHHIAGGIYVLQRGEKTDLDSGCEVPKIFIASKMLIYVIHRPLGQCSARVHRREG